MDDFLLADLKQIDLLISEINFLSWVSFGVSVVSGLFLLMVIWWSSKNNPKGPFLQLFAVITLPLLVFSASAKVTISPLFKPCSEEIRQSIHCITSYEEILESTEVRGDAELELKVQKAQIYQNQNKFYLSIPKSIIALTLFWSLFLPISLLFFTQRRVIA